MRPEFSERQFEFCFNSEFIRKNSGAIVGMPFIPSQRIEELLGYDIQIRLQNTGVQYSLFLQHKISHFVTHRRGSNSLIYDHYGGPYLYFYLNKTRNYQQHNLLFELSLSEEFVFYSAPVFAHREIMTQHFINSTITDSSLFLIPTSIGYISDSNTHKVSYNPDVTQVAYHSELKEIQTKLDYNSLVWSLGRKKIDESYISELLIKLERGLQSFTTTDKHLPTSYFKLSNIGKCVYLLKNFYKLQWILF